MAKIVAVEARPSLRSLDQYPIPFDQGHPVLAARRLDYREALILRVEGEQVAPPALVGIFQLWQTQDAGPDLPSIDFATTISGNRVRSPTEKMAG
jgi:hypothetical protein